MRQVRIAAFCLLALTRVLSGYEEPVFPFAPKAEDDGSTAILYTDPKIVAWATDVTAINFGTDVSNEGNWKDPQSVIGHSAGGNSEVLVLGRGGAIVLEFGSGIADLEGFDFVVFENAFSDTFLELAYVEVSSDGVHFVRFPNYSMTVDPVGSWGHIQATFVDGYAGKYRAGFGTPFNLSILESAHQAIVDGYGGFSQSFSAQLLTNYPYLNLNSIKYLRLIDIVGDGTYEDCQGYTIYDPYPTIITAGFDLDAVGVINTGSPELVTFMEWATENALTGVETDDFDQDGWMDMLEYQFSTDPTDLRNKPVIQIERNPDGTGYKLVYRSSASVEGQLNLQYSHDGTTWTLLDEGGIRPVDQQELIWIDGEPFIERTVHIPNENGEGFFRWEVLPVFHSY